MLLRIAVEAKRRVGDVIKHVQTYPPCLVFLVTISSETLAEVIGVITRILTLIDQNVKLCCMNLPLTGVWGMLNSYVHT